jgi:hypothetical protein
VAFCGAARQPCREKLKEAAGPVDFGCGDTACQELQFPFISRPPDLAQAPIELPEPQGDEMYGHTKPNQTAGLGNKCAAPQFIYLAVM